MVTKYEKHITLWGLFLHVTIFNNSPQQLNHTGSCNSTYETGYTVAAVVAVAAEPPPNAAAVTRLAACIAAAMVRNINFPLSSAPWNSMVCTSPLRISSVSWMEPCK